VFYRSATALNGPGYCAYRNIRYHPSLSKPRSRSMSPRRLPGTSLRMLPGGSLRRLPGGSLRRLPGTSPRRLTGYVAGFYPGFVAAAYSFPCRTRDPPCRIREKSRLRRALVCASLEFAVGLSNIELTHRIAGGGHETKKAFFFWTDPHTKYILPIVAAGSIFRILEKPL
jgi:hypothetical protein